MLILPPPLDPPAKQPSIPPAPNTWSVDEYERLCREARAQYADSAWSRTAAEQQDTVPVRRRRVR